MALLVMERHFSCRLDWHDTVECGAVATDRPIRLSFYSFQIRQPSPRVKISEVPPCLEYYHGSLGDGKALLMSAGLA